MADLAAALDALAAPKPARCSVAAYLAGLAERDAALHARVVGLIDDPGVLATALVQALKVDGFAMSVNVLRAHRKRGTASGCRCPR